MLSPSAADLAKPQAKDVSDIEDWDMMLVEAGRNEWIDELMGKIGGLVVEL